jgi:2-hydroxychromene-2-carboxylate isomerase
VRERAFDGLRVRQAGAAAHQAPRFYFHLASPECYLAAERISELFSVAPEWMPVEGPFELGLERAEIERLVIERGLQPLRWPASWPPRTHLAMRAATYAKSIGRVTAFSLAAFRQAFAAGRDLDNPDTVVIAGAACEIHPAALLRGVEMRSVALALEHVSGQARSSGVRRLPALVVGGLVFEGDAALVDAADAVAAAP